MRRTSLDALTKSILTEFLQAAEAGAFECDGDGVAGFAGVDRGRRQRRGGGYRERVPFAAAGGGVGGCAWLQRLDTTAGFARIRDQPWWQHRAACDGGARRTRHLGSAGARAIVSALTLIEFQTKAKVPPDGTIRGTFLGPRSKSKILRRFHRDVIDARAIMPRWHLREEPDGPGSALGLAGGLI